MKHRLHINHFTNIPTANILDQIDINTDLTHWDVSYVSDASRAFYNTTTFNQNIGGWDVSKATDILPTTSVKVFAATVIPTLECFPPRLGVTITVY
jgi:hypothetical protein